MKRVIPILLLAAACSSAQPSLPPQTEDTCNAGNYANLVGQDATALEKTLLLGPVRVIRPGGAVTMDFLPERINFAINQSGKISRIYCG